jgi:hypothetical protein
MHLPESSATAGGAHEKDAEARVTSGGGGAHEEAAEAGRGTQDAASCQGHIDARGPYLA